MRYSNAKKRSVQICVESLEERTLLSYAAAVRSFTLINADTDRPIATFNPLKDGATLNLATLPTRDLNIRANTSSARIGSVKFGYDGNPNTEIENSAPYALAGDDQGDYRAWTPTVGTHTLTATPYRLSDAHGIAGKPLTITFTVIDTQTVPAAPTNLVASPASSTQVDLTWTDNSNNETGFRIERETGTSGPFVAMATVGAGQTSYSDTTAAPATQYTYRVIATNSAGDSPSSNLAIATTPSGSDQLPAPIAGTNYHLAWNDEFNGTSVDTAKWNEVGPWGKPVSSTWANFRYSPSNVSVANGVATITAQRSGSNWTGGILSTDTTKMFQYGFVEVRAQLPKGQGFWPAIWLYGGATADELDTMEFLGGDASSVYQTYHFPGGFHQAHPSSADWTSGYHLFQMKWEPGRITFYVDNVETGSWTQSVPSRPMYLMLNFDVGGAGDWGGAPDGSTPSTAQFNVDYVRIYQ